MRSKILFSFAFIVFSFLASSCIFGVDVSQESSADGWKVSEGDTDVKIDTDTYTDPKDSGWDSEVYADAEDTYETDNQPPMDTDVSDSSDTRDVSDTQDGGEVDTDTNCSPTSCPAPSSCAKGVEGIDKCGSSGCECVKYTGHCKRVKGNGRKFTITYDSRGRKKERFDTKSPNTVWKFVYSGNSRCPEKREKYISGQLENTANFTCKNGKKQKLERTTPSFTEVKRFRYNKRGELKKKEVYRDGSKVNTVTYTKDSAGNVKRNSAGYEYYYNGCNNSAP